MTDGKDLPESVFAGNSTVNEWEGFAGKPEQIGYPTFPLTADEAKLLYDELETHTCSKHHPMYHYHSGLLSRMRSFIENNQDKLRICENSNPTKE